MIWCVYINRAKQAVHMLASVPCDMLIRVHRHALLHTHTCMHKDTMFLASTMTHTHIHTHIHTHAHTYKHTPTRMRTYKYTHTHTHTHTRTYAHLLVTYTRMRTHAQVFFLDDQPLSPQSTVFQAIQQSSSNGGANAAGTLLKHGCMCNLVCVCVWAELRLVMEVQQRCRCWHYFCCRKWSV
jgi:hypothetical protein